MNLDTNKLQQLVSLFEQSLNYQTTVQAGNELQAASKSPDFLLYLLAILQEQQVGIYIRVATALFFKNFVVQQWKFDQESENIIPNEVREIVRNQIIDLMVKSDSKVQIHLCEIISKIAEHDYPNNWEQLISQLTSQLTESNVQTNLGVLQTINSIFKRWRSDFGSDNLFTVINFSIAVFGESFLNFTKLTDQLIDQNASNPQTLNSLLETLNILWQIYQSLISHDIPQYLVDNAQVFQGLLCKYLVYENPTYSNSNYSNDEDIGNLEHVKIEILEIINLYIQKYYEDFPQIHSAVKSTWDLVTRLDSRPKFDLLTSKALTLLSTAVKNRSFQTLFGNPEVLSTLSSNVIIPNATLREVDEELFTDEPMEYIKRDLEGTDSETRRRSAADLVRSLLMTFQKEWTELFTGFIHTNLDLYKSDPVNNWKNKDTAIFLLSSIATTKQATSLGVTTSNEFIDVANIFSTHILPDLQPESQAHPILKVDSIKYLFTFRNQLTAEQLFSMLPLLIFHLGSDDQLVHTYAAVAIERILAMKSNHKSVFTSESLKPLLENLLTNLFNLTFKSNSAQQVAENDYLMKTIMRTVIVAGPAILPYSALLAKKLSDLLKLIASNPSNPKYSHYAFEAIGACIRLAKNNPENFLQLESAFQDTFQLILTQNIEEFIPYALQILAQVLTFHPTPGIPDFYQNLLSSVLQPVLWQKEGNVPALTRLLRSYLVRSAKFETQITQPNILNSILGIFQKLISSKINESYGFELVREIFIQIPIQVLQPYLTSIANLMLSRLQKSKTNKFVYEFTLFVSVLLTADKPDWNPDFAIRLFESIQQNLFSQLTQHFIVNTIPLISGRDNRKLVIAGMVSLLTQTNFATVDPLKQHWSTIANNVMTLLQSPEIVKADVESELQQEEELIRFEVEETTFSTAFVNLATSSLPPANPAVGIPDISAHAISQLQGFNHKHPGFVRELASQLPEADSNTLINQFHNLGINV